MKSLRSVMFALGLLLLVSAAHAQTTAVSGRVPFDFVVGNQVYPAGEYTLRSVEGMNNVLTIRNEDESSTKLTLTHSREKLQPAEKTMFVFHRVGDQYFLAELWVAGNSRGLEIPKSPIETKMAQNRSDRDDVIVAALTIR
jgi:hypothetical protein